MKKTLAIILSILMCGLLVVSAFAGQYKYEGKGFSFESDLAMDNLGVDSVGEYINEEDYGSGKAPDYYSYEIENQGDNFFEIEIEAYCGRFNFPLDILTDSYDGGEFVAEGPKDYYEAIEVISKDRNIPVTEFNGCPAVIMEDTAKCFECYVCNDEYLYSITISWIEDTAVPAEFTQAVNDVKNIKFTSPCSYKFVEETEPVADATENAADTNATGAVEGTETQQDKTGTALIAIIAVAGVAVVVLAVVCIVLVTKKKK